MFSHDKALEALEAIEDVLASHQAGDTSASLAVASVERIFHDYEASLPVDREHTSRQAAERMRRAAEAFAHRVHLGRTDRLDPPDLEHFGRVAARARAHAETISRNAEFAGLCEQAGWLHATIEDAGTTADDLRADGFDSSVVRAVERLIRSREAPYLDHIRALVASGDLIAMTVKLADDEDTIDPSRSSPPRVTPDQLARYTWSAALLRNNLMPNGSADPVTRTDATQPRRRDA